MVTFKDLIDHDIIDNLTRHLQRLHAMSSSQTGLVNWAGEVATHSFKRKKTVDLIRDAVPMIPKCGNPNKSDAFETHRKAFNDDVFLKECNFLETILADLDLPVVLSHNDFHHGNLVLNEDYKGFTILDYELTAINYEYCDIAFLMMAWQIRGTLGHYGPDVLPLTDEIREAYVKSYLRAKYEASDHNPSLAITDKQVKLASTAVHILETVECLRYVATAMMFTNSGDDIDLMPVIALAKNVYENSKSKVKRLRDTYLQLRAELKLDAQWQTNTGVRSSGNKTVMFYCKLWCLEERVNTFRNMLIL